MSLVPIEKRRKIIEQSLAEIAWARQYKRGKIRNWKLNEDLYYGRKLSQDTSRANVDLGRMQEFVHTLLSKIDNPLLFKFVKRKESQLKRAERLNSLRTYDAQRDNWDIKDIAGKKQAIIYGRAIYSYAADSVDGYKPHLENVDVYDFLIDPSAGGLDIERAYYMGRYGVVKSRQDLERGMKDRWYSRTETKILLEGSGNATDTTQETIDQQNRTRDTGIWNPQQNLSNPDKFVFWEWYTTFEGERYYVLITETGGQAVRIVPLKEIFESEKFPFWTWAAFVDLTEFWTPSFADYVREMFMAQAVSINQMLDNAEQRNKPQKAINTLAIKNIDQLKYQRGGNHIEIDGTAGITDVNQAIRMLEVPEIKTPMDVFNTLGAIIDRASGVTAAAAGEADADGKATIYEGNQAATADRFGLLNKSYSFGYKRFATLWEEGAREHLKKKMAIEILGPNGVEIEEVSSRDIFRKNDTFGVLIESSNAETALSELEKRTKIQFLSAMAQNPAQNPQKAYEIGASIAGFDDDTIRQLLDTSEFGNASIMSEAQRDIESLLDGKDIKPNAAATPAYKQAFIDFALDNEENMDAEQKRRFQKYMDKLNSIILMNMQRKLEEQHLKMAITAPMGVPSGAPPAPMEDPTASINQIAPTGI